MKKKKCYFRFPGVFTWAPRRPPDNSGQELVLWLKELEIQTWGGYINPKISVLPSMIILVQLHPWYM